jgi:hypothetical protein
LELLPKLREKRLPAHPLLLLLPEVVVAATLVVESATRPVKPPAVSVKAKRVVVSIKIRV